MTPAAAGRARRGAPGGRPGRLVRRGHSVLCPACRAPAPAAQARSAWSPRCRTAVSSLARTSFSSSMTPESPCTATASSMRTTASERGPSCIVPTPLLPSRWNLDPGVRYRSSFPPGAEYGRQRRWAQGGNGQRLTVATVPAPTGTRAAATSAAASANLHGFPRGTSICAADSELRTAPAFRGRTLGDGEGHVRWRLLRRDGTRRLVADDRLLGRFRRPGRVGDHSTVPLQGPARRRRACAGPSARQRRDRPADLPAGARAPDPHARRSAVAENVRAPVKSQTTMTLASPSMALPQAQPIKEIEPAAAPATRPRTPSAVIHDALGPPRR